MKPQFLILGAAAIAAGLAAFFVLSGDSGSGPSNDQAGLIIETDSEVEEAGVGEQDESLASLTAPGSDLARTEAEFTAPTVAAAPAKAIEVSAIRNIDPATARRVTVEILWPANVPAAEADGEDMLIAWADQEVAPEDFDWGSESFRRARRRRSSGYAALRTLEERASDEEVRFDVTSLKERLTTVEVLFDASAKEGRLQLASQYLYLPEAVTISLESGVTSALLEPQLGAWVTGRVDPGSETIKPDATGAYGTVALRGGTMGRGRGRRMNFVDQTAQLKADLSFDFFGVNPDLVLQIAADVPGLAPMTSEVLELSAGAKSTYDLALQKGGSLSGRVLDLGGQPVAGALVVAAKQGGMFGGGGSKREGNTDAEGRFSLLGLEAGSYRPTVTLEGWRDGRAEDSVELGVNEARSDVIITMDAGLVVVGRILLPSGAPAVGAEIRLSQPKPNAGGGGGMQWGRPRDDSERKEAVAGQDGTFRFSALADTTARLAASLSWSEGTDAVPTTLAAALDEVEPASAKSARPVEIRLAPTVTVTGRVVDDLGAAVTSFEVRAAREGFSSRSGTGDGVRERFTDVEDGTFVMDGASPGPWRVSVTADGFESREDQTVSVALPQTGEAIEFALTRLGSVRGVVVDANGLPVPGAEVRRKTGGFGNWNRGAGVESEADGTFTLGGLAPGSQTLVASSEDWAPSEETEVEVLPGVDTEGVVLTLREGGVISGVVRDDEGNPWAGRRVTYATGGGPVAMFGGESTTDTDAGGRFRFDRVAPGKWVVNASPGEREMMTTMQSGDRQSAFFDLMAKNLTANVVVADGEEVSVDLGAEARDPVEVFGTVTRNGEAVQDGNVTFAREGEDLFSNLKRAPIGQNGEYRVELDRPGAYVLSVERGAKRNQFLMDVASGAEQRMDLALPEGGISGRVRDSNGGPAAGVRVTAESQAAFTFARFQPRSATTDEDGNYDILELDPGTYTLRFGSPGFGPGARGNSQGSTYGRAVIDKVEVSVSAVTSGVNVEIQGAGRITGIVQDLSGSPVAGATIFVRDKSGRSIDTLSTTRTGSSGRFTYDRISPGTYSVSARTDAAAAPEVTNVVVKESEDANVELDLADGSMLIITTIDDEEEPVRAQLSVLDKEGREMTGMLTVDIFRNFGSGISTTEQKVGPVTPGRYTVLATSQDGRTVKKRVTVRDKAETKVRVKFKD